MLCMPCASWAPEATRTHNILLQMILFLLLFLLYHIIIITHHSSYHYHYTPFMLCMSCASCVNEATRTHSIVLYMILFLLFFLLNYIS